MTERTRLAKDDELYAQDVLAELLELVDAFGVWDLRTLMLKYSDDPRAAARAILEAARADI